MRFKSFRVVGMRCFEDTGNIDLGPGCNVFVGQNNSGKSTLLKGLIGWQLRPFSAGADARKGTLLSESQLVINDVKLSDYLRQRPAASPTIRYIRTFHGTSPNRDDIPTMVLTNNEPLFASAWPKNFIVPYIARRKAVGFNENVAQQAQSTVDGTLHNLYARIDRVASPGTKAHTYYKAAVEEILGVFITTSASVNGKMAGYYFDDDTFVPIEQMGDGVAEIASLLVDLSLAENKVFILEEPETNLHPRGLKALLELIRVSSANNQFIVATHSNIVVRELGADESTKVFRVFRDGIEPQSPSCVEEVERTPNARLELLRELGYEFGDFDLHDAWLFLEESSAERVIRDVLIPWFVPKLAGRLRTYSAGGVDNVEPSVVEFQRVITFVHLSPVYRDRIWIRVDGDEVGRAITKRVVETFPYLSFPRAGAFSKSDFEMFYPVQFADRVSEILLIGDRQRKRNEKKILLEEVLQWTCENESEARTEWAASASEQIEFLKLIQRELSR
jgi:predicted ATPase